MHCAKRSGKPLDLNVRQSRKSTHPRNGLCFLTDPRSPECASDGTPKLCRSHSLVVGLANYPRPGGHRRWEYKVAVSFDRVALTLTATAHLGSLRLRSGKQCTESHTSTRFSRFHALDVANGPNRRR